MSVLTSRRAAVPRSAAHSAGPERQVAGAPGRRGGEAPFRVPRPRLPEEAGTSPLGSRAAGRAVRGGAAGRTHAGQRGSRPRLYVVTGEGAGDGTAPAGARRVAAPRVPATEGEQSGRRPLAQEKPTQDRTARQQPATRRQAGGMRLTRRGRIVVMMLLAGLVLLVAGLLAALLAAGAQAASGGTPAAVLKHSMARIVVRPGETLWSIAVRAEPAADPRVVVQQIMDINALPGTTVQAGEQLWVPRA